MRRKLPFVIVVGLGLAGCASCPSDPNQAGLFCGTYNLASGRYEQDTNALQAQTSAAETRVADLKAENDRLGNELASLNAQERRLRQRQQALNNQLAQSIRRLDQLRRDRQLSQDQLNGLQRQVADLEGRQRAQADRPADAVDSAEIARLEQGNAALRSKLDQLFQPAS